jgi:glycosyltransferase involved in cell wall biosynthesis
MPNSLRVLVCHNYYRRRSGEGSVVHREIELLEEQGHLVTLFSYDNLDAEKLGALKIGTRAIYSRQTGRDLEQVLQSNTFDIAHVHNTWLLLSPAIYRYLWKSGIPVVKTIHNYRWLCPIGTFYRDGDRCHDCVEKFGGALHGVLHRCYRGSLPASIATATRLIFHRDLLHTYQRYIDVVVVQNEFVRKNLISYGFPQEKMEIKGNFLKRNEIGKTVTEDFGIFAGRLEATKGLSTLLDACEKSGIKLRIFGKGPMHAWLKEQIDRRFATTEQVQLMGYVSREEILENFANARALVFPSEWYESYPISIVEAMAHGKPVISSNIGGMLSIITDEKNGLFFEVGDPDSLSDQMKRLWSDDELYARLSEGARKTYEEQMSPEANYELLMGIYQKAIDSRKTNRTGR